jgi:hypothetical protein
MPLALFLVLAAASCGFVWLTGETMPARVASHFDLAGQANGFMPRVAYLLLMTVVGCGVPVLIAVVGQTLGRARQLRLPNAAYWLAPERRDATLAFLRLHMLAMATLLLGFVCYVHLLVVFANTGRTEGLPGAWFLPGLVVFLGATLAWALAPLLRFRLPR